MSPEEFATRRPCYVVVGRDKTGTVVDTAGMRPNNRPFPGLGMATSCRDQKAAMTGPRITWTVEQIPAGE